jgi:hypothetical protein
MLETILWALSVALAISTYSAIGYGFYTLTWKTFEISVEKASGHPGPTLTGVFWPVLGAICLPFYLLWAFKKVKLPKLPKKQLAALEAVEALLLTPETTDVP